MINFREAQRGEAIWLSSRLRPEDQREIETATGKAPEDSVPLSFDVSTKCYTIRYSNKGVVDRYPLAIFGVADDPTIPEMGIVWMLATPLIRKVWLALIKVAPQWLDKLSEDYPAGLHNIVDSRNSLHVRWLQKTGFESLGVVRVNGKQFIHAARFNVLKS